MGWRVGFATNIEDLSHTLFTNAVSTVVYLLTYSMEQSPS